MKKVHIKNAAEKAGVHPETVRRWIRAGRLAVSGTVMVRNIEAQLVDMKEVKRLAGLITSGRRPPHCSSGHNN